MATTAAERQRAYRKRHRDQGRINTPVSAHADAALRRLALHQGKTQREVLEEVIAAAESALLDSMTPAAERKYLRQ